ncbi:MAG: hypothetical protein GXX90_00595, partial [Microbacteriaceae bacterium]|nr:hypothetical protein [Microbacteriaceae bacterium]
MTGDSRTHDDDTGHAPIASSWQDGRPGSAPARPDRSVSGGARRHGAGALSRGVRARPNRSPTVDNDTHMGIRADEEHPFAWMPPVGTRCATGRPGGWTGYYDARASVLACDYDADSMVNATDVDTSLRDYTPPTVPAGASYDPSTADDKYDTTIHADMDKFDDFMSGKPYTGAPVDNADYPVTVQGRPAPAPDAKVDLVEIAEDTLDGLAETETEAELAEPAEATEAAPESVDVDTQSTEPVDTLALAESIGVEEVEVEEYTEAEAEVTKTEVTEAVEVVEIEEYAEAGAEVTEAPEVVEIEEYAEAEAPEVVEIEADTA